MGRETELVVWPYVIKIDILQSHDSNMEISAWTASGQQGAAIYSSSSSTPGLAPLAGVRC